MLNLTNTQHCYDIIARKDLTYDGLLFVGVTSTSIFCRPGCPAKTPKPENCHFFSNASAALLAGFRACKRCHPARSPGEAAPLVKQLITLCEQDPERRWREADLKELGIDPSTARRQFKARFGLTFTQYARARRLAVAAENITSGQPVIQAQLGAGYDSPSGFRAAFGKTYGRPPKQAAAPLLIDWIDTPLGPMIAICDSAALYMLEFTIRKNLEPQISKLCRQHGRAVTPGRTAITTQIETELAAYFAGDLQQFQTPLHMTGTEFQKSVWQALINIPYGQTRSYAELASSLGKPKAVRAAASSNANNRLALIIPCHRVIAKDGSLGGYAGGLPRKQWLLDLEANGGNNAP